MQRTERRKLCSRTLMAVKGGKFFLVQGPESMPLAAVLLEALKQNLGKIFGGYAAPLRSAIFR